MEIVYASLVTAVSGVIVSLIQKFRKENREDHDVVATLLKMLHTDVNLIDTKFDRHIEDHSKEKL